MYCPFGAGHESVKEEGRFLKLARDYPKQYAYIMGGGAYDPEDGFWKPTKEGLGFAHVFDEINRLIPTKTGRPYIRYLPEGGEMERAQALAEIAKIVGNYVDEGKEGVFDAHFIPEWADVRAWILEEAQIREEIEERIKNESKHKKDPPAADH